jgi:hypothetical protein
MDSKSLSRLLDQNRQFVTGVDPWDGLCDPGEWWTWGNEYGFATSTQLEEMKRLKLANEFGNVPAENFEEAVRSRLLFGYKGRSYTAVWVIPDEKIEEVRRTHERLQADRARPPEPQRAPSPELRSVPKSTGGKSNPDDWA